MGAVLQEDGDMTGSGSGAETQTQTQTNLQNGVAIPAWLRGVIDAAGLESVRSAVIAAERRTSAEIVPMIVHRSITIGHVPLVLFFAQALILWMVLPYVAPYVALYAVPVPPYWLLEGIAVVFAFALTALLSRFDFWRRFLTPAADRTASVMSRAQLEFYQSNIKATQGSTGVLIFVSLLEHQAVVLADKAVSDRLPPDTWTNLMENLLIRIKQNEFSKGLCEAVSAMGDLLAKEFPIQPGDHNELPNTVIVKS